MKLGVSMRHFVIVLAAGLFATPAISAEKIHFGSVPPWVTPVALPSSPNGTGDTPVRMILADQQLSFENGATSSYTSIALKVLTAQGLAAGNVNFAWSPESDTVTVHKLAIRRGSQVIDVLASGQTFTVVRRESNLESAMLDGVLTASIQPEGLQVGDIIELAVTTVRRDPVMKGHVEAIGAAWNGLQITRGHFRAQWPTTMNVQFRAASGLGRTSLVTRRGRKVLELTQDNIEPVLPPKGAPARFSAGRSIELTDFASWDQPAKLLGPLYVAASKIPATGPLRDEVEKIRKGYASPTARTEAALKLVQERVRYVALLMGTAGYVPANAVDTWSRRFGDCKAKTALLLGILHEFGIKAEPVAVNAGGDEAIPARLPMLGLFNHVLVRASVEGREYWLDGTRLGDTNLARLQTPSFGWGLPLTDGAKLARLQAAPLAQPTMETIIKTDASAGLTVPAPSQYEVVMRGDYATSLNTMISSVSSAQRDQMLNSFFKDTFSDLQVKTARMAYNQSSNELRLFADGALVMNWSAGSYEPEGTAVGFKPEFDRPAGPMQQVPFAVEYPVYTKVLHSITMPAGFSGGRDQSIPELKETLAGVEYHRKASFEKDLFKVTTTVRSIVPEISYKEAQGAAVRLAELSEQALQIRTPAGYRKSQAEIERALAKQPTTADNFVTRGLQFLDLGRNKEAEADFTAALKLDPNNAYALADRAIARTYQRQFDLAEADLKLATAADPGLPLILRAKGILSHQKGDMVGAIRDFSAALKADPRDGFSRARRAQAHAALSRHDEALADAGEALKTLPNWADLHLLRANIFRRRSNDSAALAEADAIVATDPKTPYPLVVAANLYAALGAHDRSAKAFERALALKPEPFIYLNRSQQRPVDDVKGRSADLDAALKLDPTDGLALAAKADLFHSTGKRKEALLLYNRALVAKPDDLGLRISRGVVLHQLKRPVEATKDFAIVRSKLKSASDHNVVESVDLAGVTIDRLVESAPDVVRTLPPQWVYPTVRETGEAAQIIENRKLALAQIGYGGSTGDWLTVDAIGILMKRGNTAGATDLLRYLDAPREVENLLIDRRFAALWEKMAEQASPRLARSQMSHVAGALQDYSAKPSSAEELAELIGSYRHSQRYGDAFKLREKLPSSPAEFAAAEEQMGWAVNNMAQALHDAGRADEADALFASLNNAVSGHWRINMLINRIELLVFDGKFAQSLPLISEAEKADKSAYAEQLLRQYRYCVLSRLGRAGEAAKLRGDMLSHAKDALAATIDGLVCTGDLDTAEQLALGGLNDDDFRTDFVRALQAKPLTADGTSVWGGWTSLRQRPAIAAAFSRVGRDLPEALRATAIN